MLLPAYSVKLPLFQLSNRKAELRGAVGTVQQIWGNPNYRTALLVRLEDERYELFWHHELNGAEEEAIGA